VPLHDADVFSRKIVLKGKSHKCEAIFYLAYDKRVENHQRTHRLSTSKSSTAKIEHAVKFSNPRGDVIQHLFNGARSTQRVMFPLLIEKNNPI
jgi:hypothetical protein